MLQTLFLVILSALKALSLDYNGCGSLYETRAVIPGQSNGTMTSTERQEWYSDNCEQKLCYYWRIKFGVEPFDYWTVSNSDIQTHWSNLKCDSVSVDKNTICQVIQQSYAPIPYVTWASTPSLERKAWEKYDCNFRSCHIWRRQYSMTAADDLTLLPTGNSTPNLNLLPSNNHRTSWSHSEMSGTKRINQPQNQCEYLHEMYGLVPFSSNGSSNLIARWNALECNRKMCIYWRQKYGIYPFGTISGKLPTGYQDYWNHPDMYCTESSGEFEKTIITIHEQVGYTPFANNTTNVSAEIMSFWNNYGGNEKLCVHWRIKYDTLNATGIPTQYQNTWIQLGCASIVVNATKVCQFMLNRYDVPLKGTPEVPSITGTDIIPPDKLTIWNDLKCINLQSIDLNWVDQPIPRYSSTTTSIASTTTSPTTMSIPTNMNTDSSSIVSDGSVTTTITSIISMTIHPTTSWIPLTSNTFATDPIMTITVNSTIIERSVISSDSSIENTATIPTQTVSLQSTIPTTSNGTFNK
jgi:hypothetical protein